jgi:uncharacterized repeat protein (TIGR01451 family)
MLAPLRVEAGAFTVYVDRDSYLKESAPSQNYGGEKELLCKTKSGDNFRVVFRFDLSTLPAGEAVTSAIATFYVTGEDPSELPVNIYRVTGNWTETGARWNNTASDYDGTTVYGSFVPSAEGFVTVDITTLVNEWHDGIHQNHGLMFISTSVDFESKYASKEWDTPAERPFIDIVTGPVNAAPAVVSGMPDTTVSKDSPAIDNYRDLNDVFWDNEDGAALAFTIESNSNPGLVTAVIDSDSSLDISIAAGQTGTATIVVRATDSGSLFAEDTLSIFVTSPEITLVKSVSANQAIPGDSLTYFVDYANAGNGHAFQVLILDTIPANTTYVPGSASGAGMLIEFSHDGGGSFDTSDLLPITHIRWSLLLPLVPGAAGTVSFSVVVQ